MVNLTGEGTLTATSTVRARSVPFSVQTTRSTGSSEVLDPLDTVDFNEYPTDGYRYFTFDIISDEMLAEIPVNDVSFSTRLAAVGDFSGVIPISDEDEAVSPDVIYDATMPMRTALYVLRGKKAVWGGIIWARSYDANSRMLQISAGTWESYLFRRHIWHEFTTEEDIDKFEVVRNIIGRMRRDFALSYTEYDMVTPVPQSSKVDIFVHTDGEHGKTEEAITFDQGSFRSFGEALTEYANNLDGFEWYFFYEYNERAMRFRRRIHLLPTPPALLKKGSDDPPYDEEHRPGIDTFVFEYPGNIATLTLGEDSDNAATRYIVLGGWGDSVNTSRKPVGSWNNNEYLRAGYPLVETVNSSDYDTTRRPKRLNNLAAMHGRDASPPIRSWQVTVLGNADPVFGTYRVGNWCRVRVNDTFIAKSLEADPFFDPSGGMVKRIMGYTVAVPNTPGAPEVVTLELEDDPTISFDLTDEQEEGMPTDEAGPYYYGTYMPDATTTGVPYNPNIDDPGTDTDEGLARYNKPSDDTVVLKSGQIIKDKVIYGDITIEANAEKPVVLRRCRLVGGSHAPSSVTAVVDVTSNGGPEVKLKMYDCDIRPRTPHANRDGIRGKRFWSIRSHIQRTTRGIVLIPGSTSPTQLNVQLQGNYVHGFYRNDSRTNHALMILGGTHIGAKGNNFEGRESSDYSGYTGPATFQTTQGMIDEVVLVQNNGAGDGETVILESNFVSGGMAQLYVDSSVSSLVWGDNKHFRLVADSGDAVHPGYWIRIESSATDVVGLATNTWQDGYYRGSPMQEPRDLGVHYDGA